ncbi:MAG: ATP-binding cassette domain-containing protein [Candidatus Marinimicrobia bacterium]|jgi:phospholipid/cholesterol/gamma-HCH transport system ATP-binding protein|nr:ATP-binding cassette domain-containing protein [Candidatus Neomarinimicrobiota bacterium]MBT3633640.1 ATP-binding cassette domain-containing protein [Candidatus Neomarinimicrobiota bacterium]MBT3682407.1 ATP-binding cassette domain-containing protein [Candidatus Neomarinimicrobiota bacterium]MBT3759171.1 ATP-binding cassette domain-containing protein [Candidatus Neomarinimicrobiota bacterium]MBT3895556.1 ATP-binding cassette domain-containing protein [Candidatus Neomarinimicrobiota bacterium
MIQVKDLHKTFEGKHVLRGVEFDVKTGEAIAIIGISGSGKSVILKHLIGLLKPDRGEVWMDNNLVSAMSFRKLQTVREKIGMVFQSGALFDSMNVKDNISLALKKLTKLKGKSLEDRVKESLESVNMSGTQDLMPSELSGGMKKRVGIARAIAIKPEYLFYDEPTTGLDPIMTDVINRLIIKFQKSGNITTVIVTHEMSTVYDVVDRVILLHDGKIRFSGTPDEIKESEDVVVKQFINGDSTLIEQEIA